jgi:Voltage gated chloride channel
VQKVCDCPLQEQTCSCNGIARLLQLLTADNHAVHVHAVQCGSSLSRAAGLTQQHTVCLMYAPPLTTTFSQTAGLILAAASGLSVGKEGPLIHISCAMAEAVMSLPIFRYIRVNAPQVSHLFVDYTL